MSQTMIMTRKLLENSYRIKQQMTMVTAIGMIAVFQLHFNHKFEH